MSRFMEHPEFNEEYPEEIFDEPDEHLKDTPDELDELKEVEAMEVPDVYWAQEIEKIDNPGLKKREIEAANRIVEKEQAIDEDENGELTENKSALDFEKNQAAMRSSLATVGLTWDHLGNLSEDYDLMIMGGDRITELKDAIKDKIDRIGPEAAQREADQWKEEGRLSEKSYNIISRLVRMNKADSG